MLSTSTSKTIAKQYLGSPTNRQPVDAAKVLFQIEGISGRDISDLSAFNSEREVLFDKEAKFEVVDIKFFGPLRGYDFYVVTLKEKIADPPRASYRLSKVDLVRMQSRRTKQMFEDIEESDSLSLYSKSSVQDYQAALRFLHGKQSL
jgi:hypothetical protein